MEKFREAVKKDYYFQMYYGDFTIWGFIGKINKEINADPILLHKHLHFEIMYKNDCVIEIIVCPDPNFIVDIIEDKEIEVDFTYSVKWVETPTPFEWRIYNIQILHPCPSIWKSINFISNVILSSSLHMPVCASLIKA